MNADKQREIVETLAGLVEEKYVFPAEATEMARTVRASLARGAYGGLRPDEFALALTLDLRTVNPDKHLSVRFAEEKRPVRSGTQGPSPEALAAFRRKAASKNYDFRKVEYLDGNVGCLDLRGLHPPDWIGDRLAAAMALLADTDAMILDLRKNGGGHAETVALVCSYFLPADPPTLVNTIYFRSEDRLDEMWTTPDLPGPRYLDKPVYVLTSEDTFSGGEELAYNLKHLGRATLIGEVTGGGAHPTAIHALDGHFTTAIPFARSINPITQTNWEGVGVIPHVEMPAEKALEAALDMIREN